MQWSETKHCRLRSFYDMMVPVIEMKEKKKDPISSVRTKCIQLDASGKGLVKIKDEKVLIENLLPGEEVELEYTRGKGRSSRIRGSADGQSAAGETALPGV